MGYFRSFAPIVHSMLKVRIYFRLVLLVYWFISLHTCCCLARILRCSLLHGKRVVWWSNADCFHIIWNRHGHECSRIWKLSGNFTLIQIPEHQKVSRFFWPRYIGDDFFLGPNLVSLNRNRNYSSISRYPANNLAGVSKFFIIGGTS